MPYTRTFEVTKRIADDLIALDWTPHPVTGRLPVVSVGVDETVSDESVVVRIRTDEDAAVAEWLKMGAGGREERFIVDVWIMSSVPGRSWSDMWDRLSELAELALGNFTDTATGKFVAPGGTDSEAPGWLGVWNGLASAEQHDQFGTDEGWSGTCRIAVRIAAFI